MIRDLIWPQDRIDHIALHGIEPEEVEEACFGEALVLRARSGGKNPVYYVLGQTESGRHLFCVVLQFPDGNGYPGTARQMTREEIERDLRSKLADMLPTTAALRTRLSTPPSSSGYCAGWALNG